MNYRLLLALLASAFLTVAVARADSDDEDDDQEFDYFAYFTRAHSDLKFGFRVTQGAKVQFGNLGSITATALSPLAPGTPTRTYNNGSISYDTPRANEVDASGNQTSTPGGRYQTTGGEIDSNGVPFVGANGAQIRYTTGDFVSYTPGFSRYYTIDNAAQVVNGDVSLTQYTTVSQGGIFSGKRNISGGVEVQAERLFTNPSKRFRFSLVGGVSLNGITSARSGSVSATLHMITDTFALMGGGPLPDTAVFAYTAPDTSSANYLDTAGVSIAAPKEITVPLGTTPVSTVTSDTVNGAEVTGVWEVKGSYLVVRLGPQLSASLTPNLSIDASAGIAAAYAGTNYTAIESTILTDPTLLNTTLTTGAITSEVSKFLPGYYANCNAAWAVNERTGFYAGLSYESYGSFDQTLQGRTARIDLGGSASLRGGLNIKF